MARDYADNWQTYWEQAAEQGRRPQLERAAADPVSRWLVADAPSLVEDPVDIDPGDLRADPDGVLADAREGFEAYVADADLPRHDDDRYDFEPLTIHVTTVGRVEGTDFGYTDAVTDANALVTVRGAQVVDGPDRRHEVAVVTYRCPLGHETTVRQPLLRTWSLETCGEPECSCPVLPDDARTRVRPVARFALQTDVGVIQCVGTGRYAVDEEYERIAAASRLTVTGIPRLVTDDTAGVEPRLEALAVEPSSP